MVPRDELDGFRKRTSRRTLVISLIVGAVLIAVMIFLPAGRTERGDPAPEFDLPSLTGAERLTSDQLRGSPTVVNFWASWCLPCREEAPLLEETWRSYRDDGVVFVGVNVQDTPEDARAFIEKYGITYPVVVDADRELFQAMAQVDGLPQTFFIDHKWRYHGGEVGPRLGDRDDTATLGAIREKDLIQSVETLVEGAEDG